MPPPASHYLIEYGPRSLTPYDVTGANELIWHCSDVAVAIDLLHKSHNAPVPYPSQTHNALFCKTNEHICAHFCYKWCIVGYLSNLHYCVRWVYCGHPMWINYWTSMRRTHHQNGDFLHRGSVERKGTHDPLRVIAIRRQTGNFQRYHRAVSLTTRLGVCLMAARPFYRTWVKCICYGHNNSCSIIIID